jgi:CHAT domain-containing protein/Tfp pilus assembly protein PilF
VARAERGQRAWCDQPDSRYCWLFRLLKAEGLAALGRPAEALTLLGRTVPARSELREISTRRLMDEGYARYLLAQYPRAMQLLDEAARQPSPGNGGIVSAADIQIVRGIVFARMGDPAAAGAAFRDARTLAVREHDIGRQSSAAGNLGYNLLQSSRYDEAIPVLEEALRLSQQAGYALHTAVATGNLGRCYYLLGDSAQAIALLSKADKLTAEAGDPVRQATWIGSLGEVYESLGDLPKAMSHYQRALSLSRQAGDRFESAGRLEDLALLALELHDVSAAEKYATEAMEIGRAIQSPNLQVWAMLRQASVEAARRHYPQAEAGLRNVVAQAPGAGERDAVWVGRDLLADLCVQTGRWSDAEREYQAALVALETARGTMARDEWKLTFHAGAMAFYQKYVDFLMDRGQAEHALEVVESARARVLAQKLGLKQTAWRLTPMSRFREIARQNRAVLLSYWLAPRRSFVWVVRPEGVQSFVLPSQNELKPLAEAYNAALQGLRDPLETGNPAGFKLSAALLAPVAKLTPPGSRVVLVPDGCLHELSLGALPAGAGKPRYWSEDVAIAVTPSLVLLDSSGQPPKPGRSLLLIGNPTPPGNEYAPLPDAASEVQSIRERFDASVYSGADACPQAYREAQPERFALIHFTAHATANFQSPLDSAVILSQRGDSYKLYARDVVSQPLHARLVTISACRGAGARAYSGEGLVGFAWAFLQSGAQNVIAGLWDVNDRSTAALMDRLYAEIAAGRPPAEALQRAKLTLLHSPGPWKKPYYWAAFQTFSRLRPFQ